MFIFNSFRIMKQKCKYIVLVFMMFLTSAIVMADKYSYDFDVDGIRYAKINNTKVKVVTKMLSGSGAIWRYQYEGDIVIPEIVQYSGTSYKVTTIGESAFDNANVTSISLPATITTIEPYAFYECRLLSSITLPESIDSIGYYAFSDCNKLEKVNIPEGVKSVGNGTFTGCALKEIHVPDRVETIGSNAFKNCKELQTITGLLGVISIGKNAFDGCEKLKAFDIPSKVEIIGEASFKGCASLTSMVIPPSVKTISEDMFMNCSKLKEVTISEGVQRLELDAFYGCESLSEIFIPASLIDIYLQPFEYCSNLRTIKVAEGNPKFDSRDNCNAIMSSTNDYFWGIDNLVVGCNGTVIPNSTKKIAHNNGWGAFNGSTLSQVRIPAGLTYLERFKDCYIGEISVEEGNPKYDSRNNCNAIVITESNTIFTVSNKTFIPENIVKVMGDFRPYTEMSSLYCYANVPPELQSYWTGNGKKYEYYFTNDQFQNMTLFVPKGSKSAYEKAKGWDNFWNIKEFDPTGINNPTVDDVTDIIYYDISGQQLKSFKKGINIIKRSDGTIKKVFVK